MTASPSPSIFSVTCTYLRMSSARRHRPTSVEFLNSEIERLRKVVDSAADALVKAGAEQEGWRVRLAKDCR